MSVKELAWVVVGAPVVWVSVGSVVWVEVDVEADVLLLDGASVSLVSAGSESSLVASNAEACACCVLFWLAAEETSVPLFVVGGVVSVPTILPLTVEPLAVVSVWFSGAGFWRVKAE